MLFKLLLMFYCIGLAKCSKLQQIFAYKQMDYKYPTDELRASAIASGQFVQNNVIPLGVDIWRNKMFITTPRWKNGVPSIVNYIDLNSSDKSPVLIPYPNWEANTLPSADNPIANNTIISAFRTRVDSCNRLWVMDTGINDIRGNFEQVAPPAIIIFNLLDGSLIRRYELKPGDVNCNSFLAYLSVDVTADTCDDAYVYIPDLAGYGIIVYSFKENDSWRFVNNYFQVDPLRGNYLVDGISYQWSDGIFSISYSSIRKDSYRTVYFHALGSYKEFSVSSSVLQNKTAALDSNSYKLFKLEGDKGYNTQSGASEIDEKSQIYFFTHHNLNSIGCWNTKKQLNMFNFGIVERNVTHLIYPSDMKIVDGVIYLLVNNVPKFMYETIDPKIINYRIHKIQIKRAIENTPCA